MKNTRVKNQILLVTLFSLFSCSVFPESKVNVIVQKVQEKQKEPHRCQFLNNSWQAATATSKYLFSCVDSTLDYLLSFKGAVKALVMITPFVYAYCRYTGLSLSSLNGLFDKIIQFAASIEERYIVQREIGRAKAKIAIALAQPKDTFLTTAQDYVSKTWKFVAYKGIPYAASIVFQSWMLSKNYTWKH